MRHELDYISITLYLLYWKYKPNLDKEFDVAEANKDCQKSLRKTVSESRVKQPNPVDSDIFALPDSFG